MISIDHFHPMLVHFPIALVMLGFVAECAALYFKKETCFSKMGFYLLIVGTLSAVLALSSGVFFTSEMDGTAGVVKETHELFAWITLGLLLVTSALRIFSVTKKSDNMKWLVFALYGFAAISVSITGFFGGSLVYNYMMPL